MHQTIPLAKLPAGHCACIAEVCGRAADVHRLAEFGLRDGTHLRMFRPGNPCIIEMEGSKVCVRANERLQIFVCPMEA